MSGEARHEFSVSSSELLLEAPIISVRRDRVLMPGGVEANREVVEHFGAVAVAAVDHTGKVALIEQYRHPLGRRLLELPAGILDIADEDPLVAAQRELKEESGLAATQWEVLADVVNSPGCSDEVCRVYLARGLSEVGRVIPVGDEEADIRLSWQDLNTARAMVTRGEITNSIAIAGVMAAQAVVAGELDSRPADTPFDLRPTALARRRHEAGIVPDMKKIGR